ncbi:ribonuclease HI [Pelagirhabdus alkalitolerans]|uniref:Ribonuclease HI n=1 Tax=Pelagirhabdus alkalitolerans TaxID=1612202 RepID=A0A1G6KHE6_9BACI|nr:reverse transcriptase-like protein [Pelagirhabdus alkalitolerans]SDC30248.1 ribonuclease HI [Pelagirhabdus alkalitolerans]
MNVSIQAIYQSKNGTTVPIETDPMRVKEAIDVCEDMIETNRYKQMTLMDDHDTTMTLKELKWYAETSQLEIKNVRIYFDGSFDHKTHVAGIGFVIYYEQSGVSYRRRESAQLTELTSNNEAEYAALDLAIRRLVEWELQHDVVQVYGDSKVVINQLMDEWPVYDETLLRWADRIESRVNKRKLSLHLKAINRKDNKEADRLAQKGLEGQTIESTLQLNEGR